MDTSSDAVVSHMSNGQSFEITDPVFPTAIQELKHETTGEPGPMQSQYPLEGLENNAHGDMNIDPGPLSHPPSEQLSEQKSEDKKSTKPRKRHDPDAEPRSSIHSSKNEGQHTDKRYLCYVCHKLFTRRRSVRDHIAKIHGSKSWEPLKSLEVTVDPDTGEPVESIDDVVARGPPSAPERPAAKPKKEKESKAGSPEAADEQPSASAVAPDTDPKPGAEFDLGEFPSESPKDETPERSIAEEKRPKVLASDRKSTPKVDTTEAARSTSTQPTQPAPVIGKKRPAAESLKPLPSALTKKGTAKPRPKKPRLTESDSVSDRGTPFRSPSATPLSARPQSSKLKKQLSAASSPASSRAASVERASPSPSVADTPGSSNDDGEVFCICRRGDNHTWMIACDGVCEEWYHGKCVNIRERDGDLIDKYICPRCTRDDLQTTWKRMCRRQDCRKPARVFQDPPSKYCSKECGRMFFVELVRRGDPYIETLKNDQFIIDANRPKKMRKKRKAANINLKDSPRKALPETAGDAIENSDSRMATPAYSEEERSEYETDSSADEDELPNRGGPLRAGEVKAITEQCKTLDQWIDLGRKPDTPPPESEDNKAEVLLDDFEKTKLAEIQQQKVENTNQLAILDAREKFLDAVKARSGGITDEVKKSLPKSKDLCGYDPRLAWNEDVFNNWYHTKGGREILNSANPKIGPPDDDMFTGDDGQRLINGVDDNSDGEGEGGRPLRKGGICVKNKCPRHRQWARTQLAEIRFEQDVIKRCIRKTEELERGIKDRASLRAWERQ
ncbi:uncharacterized protein HMPREF1541_07720 [Cyphellophora europaea CBS 101466]|uniref:PHD-type domain-containing protein n=1 Tax=Cyphellophora europaea (strain CBS 101466) TaxID=1220924 RepID=W2RNJ7_CYPE1|nr:uncharacterized protein HMPREF1541_07720 [Cyphellophora europaea CBS 101466]ETN38096.1 hypothetical protein HMPREF1541_07720 [Cyphellophora europaea CBS 101466]